jgi:hypothetical protein
VKPYSKLLFGLSFILFVFSCKKENISNNLVGRWQIQEVYNGYVNGGDFKWSAVPNEFKSSITFSSDGSFSQILPGTWSPNQCSGTYVLINENELSVSSTCTTIPYNIGVDIDERVLIITRKVIEGEVKEKFIRIN